MQSVRDRGRSPPPPLGMWMTSHGQRPSYGGGGVLVNVQEWGCFSIFGGRMMSRGQCPRGGGGACECPRVKSAGVFQFSGGRMTSRGQCPGGGGGACECLHHHPHPFRKSCIRTCAPPIQVQTPPPPGWLRA